MSQVSLPWGGTVTGDAGPYTDDNWSDMFRIIYQTDRTVQGVLVGRGNELAVTNPSGLTIRVTIGAALVDGKLYDNTANVDNVGVAPGSGSNYYTVVLDKDFVAQTVRVSLLGPSVVAPPSVTQTDGVTWEIALAEVEITSGSVVTITDVREFVQMSQLSHTDNIQDSAVTAAKIDVANRHTRLYQMDLSGGAGTFDYNGISQDYENLLIVGQVRSSASGGGLVSDTMHINFNGSAAANYNWMFWYHDALSGYCIDANTSNDTTIELGDIAPDDSTAGVFTQVEMLITNYSDPNMYKVLTSRIFYYSVGTSGWVIFRFGYGMWKSTSGISRIQIAPETAPNTFAQYSKLTVYGLS